MRRISLLALVIMIAGCSATYKQSALSEPPERLQRGKSVTIATPANGFYGDREYDASGKMTAQAVRVAFARFSNSIAVSEKCKDLACLKGGSARSDYYVVPEILHWEDRATEWSGRPDKIEVKVTVYEGGTLRELSSTIISGASKIMSWGGDHPQDLLVEPLRSYVQSLY